LNPEFYLVGENWWTEWPDRLMDAAPWVKGDVFDAVMHYQWYKPARQYLNQGDERIQLSQLYEHLEYLYSTYRPENQLAMMNLVSSHDSDRVLSAMHNTNKYKYKSKPAENKMYHTGKPNELAYEKLFLMLVHQFTFVGAPHIWNGDEMGMWGADDPDNRKPLWWEDIEFENETPLYDEQQKYLDKPKFNKEVFDFYKELCSLRKKYKSLNYGKCEFEKSLIGQNVFSYKRNYEDESMYIYINATEEEKKVKSDHLKECESVFNHKASLKDRELFLPSFSAIVLKVK
jgi:glycosidase